MADQEGVVVDNYAATVNLLVAECAVECADWIGAWRIGWLAAAGVGVGGGGADYVVSVKFVVAHCAVGSDAVG